MQIRNTLLAAFLVIIFQTTQAQDLHFSYFQMAPQIVNPALTGAFSGTIRIGGHYRGQWLDVDGYKTPTFYADSPIMKGFRANDWVGVGINFFSDSAGPLSLKTSGGGLSAAYHFGLGKKGANVFSVGLTYGSVSQNLSNVNNALFADEISGAINSQDKQSLIQQFTGGGMEGSGQMYSDWNLGLMYTASSKESNTKIGLTAAHITTPRTGLITTNDERGLRFTLFGEMTRVVNKKWRFKPAALFQQTGANTYLEVHGMGGYLYDDKKGIILNGGLGYRVLGFGAVQMLLGAEIKDLKIGAAYDIYTGGFQGASGFQNAFELGLSYIIKIYKDPAPKPVIFCPRF